MKSNHQVLWDYKDYVVLAGLGFIIWLFRIETIAWWTKPTNPTAPTVIQLNQIGPLMMQTWPATVGAFLAIALLVYLFIRGENKAFRSLRLSAFVAICVDIIFDVHIQVEPTSGFQADVGKSLWTWMLTLQVTTLIGFLLDKLFAWRTFRLKPVLLPFLASVEFTNLMMIAWLVKGWAELEIMASTGGMAALLESFQEWLPQVRLREIGCGSYILGFLTCLLMDGIVAVFCWTVFLVQWGPALVW